MVRINKEFQIQMNREASKIKIIILDSSPVVLRGLESMLEAHHEFSIAGCHLNATGLYTDLVKVTPDMTALKN